MDELENMAAMQANAGGQEPPSEEALQEQADAAELADRVEQYERENEALRLRAEQTEARLRDTQAWGNNERMARLAVEAANAAVDRRVGGQGRPEPPKPPKLTPEEQEEVYTNPALLERFVEQKIDYGIRWALERIAPDLAAARSAAQLAPATVETLASVAVAQAREMASQQGVDPDEFNRSLPATLQFIQNAAGGDEGKVNQLAMNPRAILFAAQQVRPYNGVPVERQAAPPTIGAGSRAGRRPAKAAPAVDPVMAKMQGVFGQEFSAETLQKFNEAKAAAAGRRS
jgi:hypothetical protein